MLHRAVQICTVLLTLVGFIVAIVMIGSAPHFASAHGVCGLVVVILALAQGAFGVLRPGGPQVAWCVECVASLRRPPPRALWADHGLARRLRSRREEVGIDLLRGEIGAGAVLLIVAVLWGFGFFGLN